ncbi:hypothetical protein GCM10007205_03930 [Oxalicibacterium flavum]|uniref:DUF3613 domain-containing protein n=2 Tax=Oxalicibacterium flavum TaxID=179467 RepID=A0A8J2XWP2_9BURK|nr:hypothetical protein GCM10007205_03930 [Oxalicibacterium flavum]
MPALNSLSSLNKSIYLLAFCTLMLAGMAAHAQESPTEADSTTHEQAPTRRIGEATTNALQMQVQGSHAGANLPILGPAASLSWQRYLDSYKHPIPETFTRTLDEVGTR